MSRRGRLAGGLVRVISVVCFWLNACAKVRQAKKTRGGEGGRETGNGSMGRGRAMQMLLPSEQIIAALPTCAVVK